jgi:ribosomal protein RSM22 (predicted rRNA methylase)
VTRTQTHRKAKRAELGHEDEKFAFVVMARDPPTRLAPGRIVRKPIRNSGHVHLDLCEASGLARRTIARSAGPLYRRARDAEWGDLWPPQDD